MRRSATTIENVEGMEESQESMFREMLSLPVGSEDRDIAHRSIKSITNLINYHRARLSGKS